MSFDIRDMDPVLESRGRVGVLALLVSGEAAAFTYLRDKLGVTDGNLARHLRRLEEVRYVKLRKSFVGRRPHTSYTITAKGRLALERHVDTLTEALKGRQE